MSGKQLPPPGGGARDLTALLRSRHVGADPTPTPAVPQDAPQRPSQPAKPAMDRRSWYMPRQSADALAEAVEELHYATRQPKHVILAALVEVALGHVEDARRRIEEQG